MQLELRGGNVSLNDTLSRYITEKLAFALDRFKSRVESITVRLADVNGPKGGRDKQCRLLVRLRQGDVIHVEGAGEDPYRAVDLAAARAARMIGQSLGRERSGRYVSLAA